MKRRELLQSALVATAAGLVRPLLAATPAAGAPLADLERAHGGRLGVAILDTGSGRRIAHRGDERFLMCSTFKFLLVAAVFARVDRGKEKLDRRVVFDQSALLDWAPVTKLNVGPPGMTVAALCKAALAISDNTAANLLLARIGGPGAVTAYARGLGDPTTRLDRTEPTLNRWDGDKDTTTPLAMLADMQKVLLGNVLAPASRERLILWMRGCLTGGNSLRAGLPAAWREGDKTGSGNTAANDIAILWPPQRKPLLVTAYYDNPRIAGSERERVLAHVGRIVAGL